MTEYIKARSYSFRRGPNAGAVGARIRFEVGIGDEITLTVHEDAGAAEYESLSIDLTAEDALRLASQIHRAVQSVVEARTSGAAA